ncbi:MAG: TIGR04282 family arsenosugar biosynthesis glycosyltransferase [Thermodesulfovibrionia bacterium]|nr:TIGR04282 family arsenosugar biosynthesis glycosyltransferase [Thermodesulfovibrionia bacterium]
MKERITEREMKRFHDLLSVSMIDFDCGKLCAPKNGGIPSCCENDSVVPILFHEEYKMHRRNGSFWKPAEKTAEVKKYIKECEDYYVFSSCPGPKGCIRDQRSFNCMTFPFEPHIKKDGEIAGLSYLNGSDINCSLIGKPKKTYNPKYISNSIKFWKELFEHYPEEREVYMDESRKRERKAKRTGKRFKLFKDEYNDTKNAFIIFVRTPEAGKVKTRLMKDLGSDKTLKAYKSFVADTMKVCDGLKEADKFLGCFPTNEDAFLKNLSRKHKFKGEFNQRGKDLGEKFINAFSDKFKEGYDKVIVIGSDSPTIPVDFIKQAFDELDKKDFVLGPCTDGGYYLVGMKKLFSNVFKRIPWDSSDVLNKTLDKLYSGRVKFSLLPFWYDVDNIDDLNFYKRHVKYLKKK